ncbi:MAG: glucose-6-phosphate isomerase, cupin-type [Candidatus Fermentimicrarchaeum limneticum]|uniref:glucose-6-phosphate isomerase n=1 Tax=Fermentimicrarchaeum limneticum TaxID=2795018 RepID=A0A7D5XLG9_FERL1|nr:MAG: glucose-6-phosphate isomerase, cupin-type [Candidatus Fermentimicrarchaeum limneticum]
MDLGIKISEEGKNYTIDYENASGWRRSLSRLIDDDVVFSLKDARELLRKEGDVIIYDVYNLWKTIPRIKEISEKTGVNCDITVLNHGVISASDSGELFFTYGHRHEKGYSEIYTLLAGEAFLVSYEEGRQKTTMIHMEEGEEVLISPTSIHRLYCGRKGAVVAGLVPREAGHDYNAVKGKGMPYAVFLKGGKYEYPKNPKFKDVEFELSEAGSGRTLDLFFETPDEVKKLLGK